MIKNMISYQNNQRSNFTFSHVGIFVKDISRMRVFYEQALGLHVTDSGVIGGREIVFLSQNPEEHHQFALVSGRPDAEHFNVINQISLRVENLDALRIYYRDLEEAGAQNMDPSTHGNSISVYCHDPEGNRLEVFIDTAWYCDQPIKESIDFSQSDEQIRDQVERIARSGAKFMTRDEWVQRMRALMAH